MSDTTIYSCVGQRLRLARQQKKLSKAELAALVDCSNVHLSAIERGIARVSLPLLVELSVALEKDVDFFLLDTSYGTQERIINSDLQTKLEKCTPTTLRVISGIVDILLAEQTNQDKQSSGNIQ